MNPYDPKRFVNVTKRSTVRTLRMKGYPWENDLSPTRIQATPIQSNLNRLKAKLRYKQQVFYFFHFFYFFYFCFIVFF